MNNFTKNFLLFCTTVLICLLLLEVAVRIAIPSDHIFGWPKDIISPDDEITYTLTPNFTSRMSTNEYNVELKINELGFRDGVKHKAPIVMIGDSFLFGWGVNQDETYAALLQNKLNLTVANLGTPGYGNFHEYHLLERHIERLEPKLVIYSYYLNDPGDSVRGETKTEFLTGGRLAFSKQSTWTKFKGLIYNNWHSFTFFGRIVHNAIKAKPKKDPVHNITQEQKETWTKYMNNIHDLTKENNASLMIVILPDSQVQLDINFVEDFTKQTNTTLLDMRPNFTKDLWFEYDSHFNAKGHKVAADLIYDKLINASLVS
ncbi:MAG: SGNH/GDSL hydrolase family protein [Candidatus Nanoarchaeia archaeon]